MNKLFLENLPRFLFFTGKGGVGKTSLACASAIYLADQGKRVLLVSTDPASNVGQVLGQTIGNHITAIDGVPTLQALEIDPEQAAAIYRERIVGPVRGKLPESAVRSIEEQLSGACTTEIAAFDEFTGLMTDEQNVAKYEHVVFDTAPTGHTIRLLQLPGAWDSFIEANPEGASCLGPLSGLDKQKQQYHAAMQALTDASQTRMVLVARAQQSSLQEAARTSLELTHLGLKRQFLVVNGLMPVDTEHELLAKAISKREQTALAHMPENLKQLATDRFALLPVNVLGLPVLRALLNGQATRLSAQEDAPTIAKALPTLKTIIDAIAPDGHGLIMLMGKGGVGKTTLAAAIAVSLAKKGHKVHLTTSDPAAHLDVTLQNDMDGDMDGLQISRIDPDVETKRYAQQVLASKGKGLDAQGLALLEEDLRSPCTAEIAVFQAFSRIIRESGDHFVVMDTAPTGHTLLLLDATGAYHRDVSRHMQDKLGHFVTPMMRLQDPAQTKVIIATLPETTPVLEAAGLQAELKRAGITPWAWIVNQSLTAASPSSGLLRLRAGHEQAQLQAVAEQHSLRYAVVPMQIEEPVGMARLLEMSEAVESGNAE